MKCKAPISIFAIMFQIISSASVPCSHKTFKILQGQFAFYIVVPLYVFPFVVSLFLPPFAYILCKSLEVLQDKIKGQIQEENPELLYGLVSNLYGHV